MKNNKISDESSNNNMLVLYIGFLIHWGSFDISSNILIYFQVILFIF